MAGTTNAGGAAKKAPARRAPAKKAAPAPPPGTTDVIRDANGTVLHTIDGGPDDQAPWAGAAVGRVVHYRTKFEATRPALILAVDAEAGVADLSVVNPQGVFYTPAVPFDPEALQSWSWPPRA